MKKCQILLFGASAMLAGHGAAAALTALTTFGGGDGFLSPAENAFFAAGDNTRGMAYNPATNSVVVVSRAGASGSGVIIDPTGAQTATLNTTGITGGTVTLGPIGIDNNGVLYASNIASPVTAGLKVYRWADQTAAPTVVFSSTTITTGRMGDNLAVFGSGTSTKVALGESASSGSGARNSFAVLSTTDGSTFTGQLVTFNAPSAIPVAASFQRGITFLDGDTLIGTIGTAGGNMTIADFNGSAVGTVVDTNPQTSASERLMDVASIGGTNYLATLDSSNSTVRIYNYADPANPILEVTAPYAGVTATNTNATGGVAWGAIGSDSATLYALNTNTGLFAYTFQVPEPSSIVLGGLAAGMLMRRRRN